MMNNSNYEPTKLPSDDRWFHRHLMKTVVRKVEQKFLKYKEPLKKHFQPFTLFDKSGKKIFRVHYTSDPEVIWAMLSDNGQCENPPNSLSLSHYDKALSNLARPISLMLGEDQRQSYSWKMLGKALSIETGDIENNPFNAAIERQSVEAIEELTKQHCLLILNDLKEKKKFNIIRDYGYIAPYLVGLKFTGLSKVDRIPVLVRLFALVRNIKLYSYGASRLKFWSKNASADTFLLWTATMFGQIFGNPGNLNSGLRLAASWGATNYYKNIEKSYDNSHAIAKHTLLKRLVEVRANFLQEEGNVVSENSSSPQLTAYEYKHMTICILLEIMTSFHILIGISFANMWQPILESEGGLPTFIAKLKAADEIDKANDDTLETDKVINEVLSKNSTTAMLYRIARVPFPKYGIKSGDYICFRIRDASKHIKNKDKWLNFGPHEKCPYSLSSNGERQIPDDFGDKVLHPCFGQFWARTILKTMFLTLAEEIPEIKPTKKRVQDLGIPEILMATTRG